MPGMAAVDTGVADVTLDVAAPGSAVGWVPWAGGGIDTPDTDPVWPKAGPAAAVTAVISARADPNCMSRLGSCLFLMTILLDLVSA
jgi:hypothetical protein